MKLTWNPPDIKTCKVGYGWSVDYAPDVHEGRTRRDGSDMPARPFATTVIHETANAKLFTAFFQKRGGDFDAAFDDWAHYYDSAFQSSIQDDRWYWDRETRRQNGQIVASPRDIVDTGSLRDSQIMKLL